MHQESFQIACMHGFNRSTKQDGSFSPSHAEFGKQFGLLFNYIRCLKTESQHRLTGAHHLCRITSNRMPRMPSRIKKIPFVRDILGMDERADRIQYPNIAVNQMHIKLRI